MNAPIPVGFRISRAPRSRDFPWGRLIQIHSVGPYEIVEYAERGADNHETHPRQETGRTLFHVGREKGCGGSGESFLTLDEALIAAIDFRNNGFGARGHTYAALALEIGKTK
jgi:hypothetical protein